MERPGLLWVRSLHGCESTVSMAVAEEYFSINVCPSARSAQQLAQRLASKAVCWEFEEAHPAPLRAMRAFKAANPSLPLLMLTTQHSEELAIWAFRARVWNYLAKPVATSELRANFSTLAQLVRERHGPSRSVRFVGALLPDDLDSNLAAPQVALLKTAVLQVERHYAEKLRQATVATHCGMSSCRFSRAFKTAYGVTFSDYLMRFRIARACRLLRQGTHSATTAGLAVGFDDASHFARAFRKLLGTSPSVYQRQQPPLGVMSGHRERRRAPRGRRSQRGSLAKLPLPQAANHLEQAKEIGANRGAAHGG
jgi:AraC-like DNA-binding protein